MMTTQANKDFADLLSTDSHNSKYIDENIIKDNLLNQSMTSVNCNHLFKINPIKNIRKWSKEHNSTFFDIVVTNGKDIQKMVKQIPNRTEDQMLAHIRIIFDKILANMVLLKVVNDCNIRRDTQGNLKQILMKLSKNPKKQTSSIIIEKSCCDSLLDIIEKFAIVKEDQRMLLHEKAQEVTKKETGSDSSNVDIVIELTDTDMTISDSEPDIDINKNINACSGKKEKQGLKKSKVKLNNEIRLETNQLDTKKSNKYFTTQEKYTSQKRYRENEDSPIQASFINNNYLLKEKSNCRNVNTEKMPSEIKSLFFDFSQQQSQSQSQLVISHRVFNEDVNHNKDKSLTSTNPFAISFEESDHFNLQNNDNIYEDNYFINTNNDFDKDMNQYHSDYELIKYF